jgi:hypothetical protein
VKTKVYTVLIAFTFTTQIANAQDVYNFYFQKTDHANEMVQVKNGDPLAAPKSSTTVVDPSTGETKTVAPALKPAEAASVATAVAAPSSKDEKKNFWRLEMGLAAFTDHEKQVMQAYGSRLEYGFNKYFGIEGQIVGGKPFNMTDNSQDGYNSNYFAGALGLKLTPIHVQLFGWDFIEFSALAGAMSATGRDWDSRHQFRLAPYVGAAVAVNITDRLSVAVDGKFEDFDQAYGQMTGGLAYRF